jgi:hypothetical protein
MVSSRLTGAPPRGRRGGRRTRRACRAPRRRCR